MDINFPSCARSAAMIFLGQTELVGAATTLRCFMAMGAARLLTALAILAALSLPAHAQEESTVGPEHPELTELSKLYLQFGPSDLVDFLEPGEFRPAGSEEDGPSLLYRLFKPIHEDADQKLPLIVWIHGYGHDEKIWYNENRGQLMHTHMVFPDRSDRTKYPFYFLAPHNQKSGSWLVGVTDDEGSPTYADWVLELVDETIANNAIDPEQVTMVGISAGATATWQIGAMRPDLFAAIAPLSGTGGSLDRIGPLATVPIWAFHTKERGFEGDRSSVEHLRSLGGCAQLTLVPVDHHDAWSTALNEHHLIDWLVERRRGETCPCTAELPELPAEETQSEDLAEAGDEEESGVFAIAGESLEQALAAASKSLPAAFTLLTIFAVAYVAVRPPASLKQFLKRHL